MTRPFSPCLLPPLLPSLCSPLAADGLGPRFKARRPSHVECFISLSTFSLKWFSCCPHAQTCLAFKQTHYTSFVGFVTQTCVNLTNEMLKLRSPQSDSASILSLNSLWCCCGCWNCQCVSISVSTYCFGLPVLRVDVGSWTSSVACEETCFAISLQKGNGILSRVVRPHWSYKTSKYWT